MQTKHSMLFVAVVAIAAVACSAPAEPARPEDAGQPQYGGTFTYPVFADPFDWDLSYAGNNLPALNGQGLAYDSLLTIRHGPEVPYTEATVQPGLAERWEVSADGKTFTFHLRRGVKFAGLPPLNGRDLTAADVKWSFEYWSRTGPFKDLRPGTYSWMFDGLAGIDTPDPSTVAVKFKDPVVPFLSYAASTRSTPIVPHEIYDRDGHLKDQILGSGPYQLDLAASQKGTRWVWRKNAGYWQAGKPYIDEVRWLVIPDQSTVWSAFKTGQVDLVGRNVSVADAEQVRRDQPQAVVYEYLQTTVEQLLVNTRVPPLDRLEVRKAISLALDRDEFVKVLTRGQGQPALAGALSGWFLPEEVRGLVPHDAEQARKILAGAGYAQGINLELIFPADTYGSDYLAGLELIQAQLKKVGVTVTLKPLDKPAFGTRRNAADFVLMQSSGGPRGGDIDQPLYSNFYPTSAYNYNGVKDPKLQAMLDEERRTFDPDKRMQIMREAVRYLNGQMYWGIGIFHGVEHQVWQPALKNYAPNAWVNDYLITNSWLSR